MFKLIMGVARNKLRAVALILASFFVLIVICLNFESVQLAAAHAWSSQLTSTGKVTRYSSNESLLFHALSERTYHVPRATTVALNVVRPESFYVGNMTFNCTEAQLSNLRFPICTYAKDTDIYVSEPLLRGSYFEGEDVSRLLRLLKLDHRLQLVDIGANIGLYSLPAARMTQVLAVEANWPSIARLAKAVDLGKVGSNITLVHNAVSNARSDFTMGVDPKNQGHAFLINGTKCASTPEGEPCDTLSQTRTIFLNDLLPLMRSKTALLKVDVEGHELNIFTESSAGQFFDKVDIPAVHMEWMWLKLLSWEVVQPVLDFFRTRHYVVLDYNNVALEHSTYRNWENNVFFKKSSYLTQV